MRSLMRAQVDQLRRPRDPRKQRFDELVAGADEREDRAVVILVGVDVEQTSAAGTQRHRERVDRGPVAPLREVRDRLEGPSHGP
jgi:hypothetical protein